MARMKASKFMGGIRCKDKVNGSRKPKERGNKPNGPTQLASLWEEKEWQKWKPSRLYG